MQGSADTSGQPYLGLTDEGLEEQSGGHVGLSASGIETDVVVILFKSTTASLGTLHGQK